ncbi:hypothetical protein BGZ75_007064 [Mortierella antarctica]|nr:hypothetical protein BGZ75_007064 [Mortierella antarctica]
MVPATAEVQMQLAPPLEIPATTTDANKMAASRAEVLLLDQGAEQSTAAVRSSMGKTRTASATITSTTTPPPLSTSSGVSDTPQGLETMRSGGSPTDPTDKAGATDSAYGKKNGRHIDVTPEHGDLRSTPRQHDQEAAYDARHPSDEKYRLLKRKLKEVLEENERLGAELGRSNRRARDLRHEKNLLLDRLCAQELMSDSSHEALSSIESDSELSDVSIMSYSRSKKASPVRASALSSPKKRLLVPSKDMDAPTLQIARHPKKTTSKPLVHKSPTAAGRKEPKEAPTPSTITNVGSATQKPKRIHNSGKQGPNLSRIRKVQHVERDEEGHLKLPLTIGIITLMDIGHVVFDREAFHNERYIWPVGYKMSRSYNSMIDPTNLTTYTCSFQIDAEDQPGKPIIAGTATGAWTHVVKTANQIRRREHSNSASGPDYFGFSNATIAKMIQDLPNVDKCTSYIMQRFEEPSTTKTQSSPDKHKISTLELSMTEKPDGEDDPMDDAEDELEQDLEEEAEEEEANTSLESPDTIREASIGSHLTLAAVNKSNDIDMEVTLGKDATLP